MIFSTGAVAGNKDRRSVKKKNTVYHKPMSAEELHKIDIEMNWGYGMLPPGCFSYSMWYFH